MYDIYLGGAAFTAVIVAWRLSVVKPKHGNWAVNAAVFLLATILWPLFWLATGILAIKEIRKS